MSRFRFELMLPAPRRLVETRDLASRHQNVTGTLSVGKWGLGHVAPARPIEPSAPAAAQSPANGCTIGATSSVHAASAGLTRLAISAPFSRSTTSMSY